MTEIEVTSEEVLRYSATQWPVASFVSPDKSKMVVASDGLNIIDLRRLTVATPIKWPIRDYHLPASFVLGDTVFIALKANVYMYNTQVFYRGIIRYNYVTDEIRFQNVMPRINEYAEIPSYAIPVAYDYEQNKFIVAVATDTEIGNGIGLSDLDRESEVLVKIPFTRGYNVHVNVVPIGDKLWIAATYSERRYWPYETHRILYICDRTLDNCEELYNRTVNYRRADNLLLLAGDKIVFKPFERQLNIYKKDGTLYDVVRNVYTINNKPLFNRFLPFRSLYFPFNRALDLETLEEIKFYSISSNRYDNYYVAIVYFPRREVIVRRYLLNGVDPAVRVLSVNRYVDKLCLEVEAFDAKSGSALEGWELEVSVPKIIGSFNMSEPLASKRITVESKRTNICINLPRSLWGPRTLLWNVRVIPRW